LGIITLGGFLIYEWKWVAEPVEAENDVDHVLWKPLPWYHIRSNTVSAALLFYGMQKHVSAENWRCK
jgi:hypothetical protein